jgi:integrase
MVEAGWCRSYVNHQVNRLRRVFKWGVAEELIPAPVFQALQTLPGIRRGQAGVRESEPVKPVPDAFVDSALPFMPPPVAAMVDVQRLTGARPGEVCTLRAIDIDMSGRVWVCRPQSHKTAHHGYERQIYIGPKAQEVIRPFLKTDLHAYLFSPRDYVEFLHARRAERRTTKRTPSEMRRKRKAKPQRQPADRYNANSYRQAVARACAKAGVPHWHPHQLRHNAATNLRREFGVELARIILGHATAFTTEIYAEADRQQAVEAMASVG